MILDEMLCCDIFETISAGINNPGKNEYNH